MWALSIMGNKKGRDRSEESKNGCVLWWKEESENGTC
jgi:hypothetical protein